MKAVEYSKSAWKVLRRMPLEDSLRIQASVQAFASGRAVDFKVLMGNVGRIRVGQYRVIVRNGREILAVLDALTRQQAYGKKEMEKWK